MSAAALNDANKRTSISQLLNPLANNQQVDSTTLPPQSEETVLSEALRASQSGPSRNDVNGHQEDSSPGSSFQLRSASWELSQNGKRPEGPDPSRPYHFTPYPDGHVPDPRTTRPREGSMNAGGSNGAWPAPHEVSNMPYGTPVLAPSYSDERTGELLDIACCYSGL